MCLIVVDKVQHPCQWEKEYQTNQSWLLPSVKGINNQWWEKDLVLRLLSCLTDEISDEMKHFLFRRPTCTKEYSGYIKCTQIWKATGALLSTVVTDSSQQSMDTCSEVFFLSSRDPAKYRIAWTASHYFDVGFYISNKVVPCSQIFLLFVVVWPLTWDLGHRKNPW